MIRIHYRYRSKEKPALSRRYKTMDRAQQWLSEMKHNPNYVIERIDENAK